MAVDVHAYTMCLHDSGVAIDVNDKSRETVAFAMNESEHGVILSDEAQTSTHEEGLVETASPESAVYDFFFEREDADRDAADLVVADGDELVLRAFFGRDAFDDADEVAFLEVVRFFDDFEDGSAEDPGMEAAETF